MPRNHGETFDILLSTEDWPKAKALIESERGIDTPIDHLIRAENAVDLFNKRKAALLAVQKDDEESEWLQRLIDAATTLVDSVNGCTPYIDMRKAATKLDKIIKEGIDPSA